MCEKCHYKIQEELKAVIGKTAESCFIQQGLNSNSMAARQAIQFLIRSTIQSTPVPLILDRLRNGLRSHDLDGERRVAYEGIINVFDSCRIGTEDEAYGGLFDS